ncbi:MAG: AmmeMemoRadiSam system protein B [Chloroflexi bacterium]|nr:AmmeMemoRadiSam system protein B [Chloroflexota bacterium]
MTNKVRPPAFAGMFYPSSASAIRHTIDGFLEKAAPPELTDVRAVVAPHAGYVYSGPVAGYDYKLLQGQPTPKRIFLLGPSHRAWFSGIAIGAYDAFRTPLGEVPVALDDARALAEERDLFALNASSHTQEHCLEVQLPFLQVIYDAAPPIVPLLFGEVDPVAAGRILNAYITADDLIIVSSDLSHYHTNEQAHTLDRSFLDALLAGNAQGIQKGEACGQAPALALATIAEQRGWEPNLLDYRTSGDITGDTQRVVGYAAVAYVGES